MLPFHLHNSNPYKEKLPMFKTILRVLAVILIGLVVGVIGLVIGILFGGNFAEQFVFNGVQGYEATGQVGLILGVVIGLLAGWRWLFKRK
jgi:ABC-type cobalamin transport system permease subunit